MSAVVFAFPPATSFNEAGAEKAPETSGFHVLGCPEFPASMRPGPKRPRKQDKGYLSAQTAYLLQ